MKTRIARRLMLGTSVAILLPTAAMAQDTSAAEPQDEDVQSAREIVVTGSIGYRYREDDAAEPILVYDTDYFQRFEPLTAGDALKRVPSVTFLADVIESDGARLRGLPPGYTQILINGEKVPGANADRSFFLDRIPAELIERVEIVRSSSARRTGDAVAGTLNIKLRDGYQIDGGYLRAGGLYFDDKEVEPSLGGVFGAQVGPGRLLVGLNFQGRHNPKKKFSLRYGDSPENNPNFATDDFDNREDQSDVRDGKDYSANFSYEIRGAATDLTLSAFYVHTDRTETERSFEYDDPTAINGSVRNPIDPGNLLTDNANVNRIKQDSYSILGKLSHEWSLGKTSIKAAFASFDDEQNETEYEIDFDRTTPRFTGDVIRADLTDTELSAGIDHEFPIGDDIKFVVGGFYQDKDRDTFIGEDRNRFNLTTSVHNWNQFVGDPTDFATTPDPLVANPGSDNRIEEERIDGFALIEGETGALRWEIGVRYETTSVTIDDFTVAAADQRQTNDYEEWLPSASLKLNVGNNGRITASVARTLRRPELNFISPAVLEAELGDNDLLGNPQLEPETAWGGDIGYEHRIGSGIVGVNVFYRDVSNLIELTNTLVEGSEGPGTFVLQPQNVGDGKVYGIEFDVSTDLGFIGLPDTGIFGNFSYLDSEITDGFGDRRFNGQSKYVYNVGFIQDVKSWDAAFGATYRKQGRAFDRIVGEEIFTSYGADLEIFVEKRIGDNFTIRAVGSNLLDGAKDEVFNKFTTIGDQTTRDFDEYELESETAGPVFQIVARFAF